MSAIRNARSMFKAWRARRGAVIYRGASITVGSFIRGDDKQYVAVTIGHEKACLTPEGAALIAKQMTEWAERAEKNNSEHHVELRWQVTAKLAEVLKTESGES